MGMTGGVHTTMHHLAPEHLWNSALQEWPILGGGWVSVVENSPSKCVAGLLNLTVAHVVHTTLTSRAKSPLSLSRPAVQLFPGRESGSPTHLCEFSIPGVKDRGPEPSIEGNLKKRGNWWVGCPFPMPPESAHLLAFPPAP